MDSMQWLVPQLSLSAEAQLLQNVHELQKHGPDNPRATVELACSLLQQNAIQQAIIRQATHRIAELEQAQFLIESSDCLPWWRRVHLIPQFLLRNFQ